MQGLRKVGEFFNVEDGLERGSDRSPSIARSSLSPSDKGGDEHTEKIQASVGGAHSAASEARNRLLERGEKLNDLGEKSERLKDQSRAFADMARQLNKQEKGWGW